MAQQEEPQVSPIPPGDVQTAINTELAGPIAAVLGQTDLSLDQTLQWTADLIPFEFKTGGITAAKISWAGQEFRAGNFEVSATTIASEFSVAGKPSGTLEVSITQPGPNELAFVDSMANRIAKVIEHRQEGGTDGLHIRHLETLRSAMRILAEPGTFSEKAGRVLEELVHIGQADFAVLRVAESHGDGLRLAAFGPKDFGKYLPEVTHGGLSSKVMSTGEPVLINEYLKVPYPLPYLLEAGVTSALLLPVKAAGRNRGVIIVSFKSVDHLTPRTIDLLSTVCDSLGMVLENARLQEEERFKAQSLEALFTIASQLVQPGTLNEKATQVLETVLEVLQIERASLRVLNTSRDTLETLAFAGEGGGDLNTSLPATTTIAQEALSSGHLSVTNNYQSREDTHPLLLDLGVQSLAAVSISVDEEALGILSVSSRSPGHFTPERLQLLQTVANGMGPLVVNAQLQEADRLRTQELEAVVSIEKILAASGSFTERAAGALREVVGIMQANSAFLWVPDERREQFHRIAAAWAEQLRIAGDIPDVASGGLLGESFRTGRILVVNNYPSSDLTKPHFLAMGLKSAGMFPVRAGDRIMGVVAITSLEYNHFTPQRIRLLETVASEIGPLMENAQLQQEISTELEQGRKRVLALQEAAERLRIEEDEDQALRQLVDNARWLLGARFGAMVVLDDAGEISWRVLSGVSADQSKDFSPEEVKEGVRLMLRSMGPTGSFRSADLSGHGMGRFRTREGLEGRTLMATGIQLQGKTQGAIYVIDREDGREFSEDDERLMSLFAVLAGVLIDNLRLYDTAEKERSTLSAIQSSMTEGLVVVDTKGSVKYRNTAAAGFLGLSHEEAVGKPMRERLKVMQSRIDNPECLDLLWNLATGRAELPNSFEMRVKHPKQRNIMVNAFQIPMAGSDPMAGFLFRDVTEERALEERRNEFVSTASHELRTPMTSILGFAELLLEREPTEVNRRTWLESIYRESQRLSDIVEDMLDVALIQTGKLRIQREPVALENTLRLALDSLGSGVDVNRVVKQVDESLPLVDADRDKVAQILVNLISNALKYSPSTQPVTVEASHDSVLDQVVVTIADQGVGISPYDQERLFTTFHHVRHPEMAGVRGTGLGLYIVKNFVDTLGGEIWVQSEPGVGSTFFFTLPVHRTQKGVGA